jgi:hypothetical protein
MPELRGHGLLSPSPTCQRSTKWDGHAAQAPVDVPQPYDRALLTAAHPGHTIQLNLRNYTGKSVGFVVLATAKHSEVTAFAQGQSPHIKPYPSGRVDRDSDEI